MATLDEEEEFEHTLFVCREVRVYKVPPMNSGGVRSGEWKVADEIWRGRLRVSAQGKKCSILLEDPKDGTLFAECPYHAGRRAASITDATDSSRNFVLRLDDGKGHHAFVGMGFQERNDAFDFNVALTSHDRQVAAASAAPSIGTGGRTSSEAAPQPHIDRRLKEGETIHVGGIRKGTAAEPTVYCHTRLSLMHLLLFRLCSGDAMTHVGACIAMQGRASRPLRTPQ